ncbi:MAG TPA: UDP-3-O-(3-hydroxymyristoyl)glucosamine N-acyltransferase [Candidatus Acidoferrales bacterium]|nr:UDP-3-O-(3-hydroxymyristoyl)glucosamine N-acyltransferase [Candidatus Acidoferrales bacterium]
MNLADIAARLKCDFEGDAALEISGVAGIEEAQPGQLTFLSNRRYRPLVAQTRASAIIVSRKDADISLPRILADDPYLAFAHAVDLFYSPPRYAPGIHSTAVISSSAKIGPGAHIGPHCFVDDDAAIGANAVLHSFVSIYRGARIGDDFFAHSHVAVREFCRIGDRVILQNGVVVGGDGFGFARRPDGSWHKIQQSGVTSIGDDVEIQANSVIDRATVGETRISRGAKIDNLVQVGHACKIGEDSLLCAQVGLAGSTVVGNRCVLAGQSASAGHLHMHDGATLTAQSAVHHDIPAGETYSGSPGMENKTWLRCVAIYNHLPELQKTVRDLEAEVSRLREARKA